MSSEKPTETNFPEDDADRIAAVVTAVDGVAALHAGMFGEVATYLPGRRVSGVRISTDRVDVHVSLTLNAPVRETATAIQRAVAAITDLPVDITVEDLVPVTTASRRELQ
ncbi:MAG: Asp23/Gls24 family envelope stress response protein [Mycobacterium sp.]